MGYRVAVVGATGNVGREVLELLAERNFPADDVVVLASEKSAGRKVMGFEPFSRYQTFDSRTCVNLTLVSNSGAGLTATLTATWADVATR